MKPGATVLLSASDARRQDQVVLAYQRYGRGKAFAMPIQDSFLWYMNAKLPVEDKTHATYWRRLVRWLVDGVPGQVNVTTQDRVEPGETVKIATEVLDSAFVEVNDARVTATVTSPDRTTAEVPLDWIVEHDGDYRGSFVADAPGLYEVRVVAARGEKTLGTSVVHVQVSAGDNEYFDAPMRAPLLKRIAEETGGRFFTASNASALPEAISYSGRGVTVVEERELWDMPVLLILMIGLLGAEWGYRRVAGACMTMRLLLAALVLAGAAVSRRGAGDAPARHHRRLAATRSTRSCFSSSRRASSMRRKRRTASPTRTSSIWPKSPTSIRRASAAGRTRKASRRHSPTSPRKRSRPTRYTCCSSATAASTARWRTFNIPGPDLTADDYAKMLGRLQAQRIVFVTRRARAALFYRPWPVRGGRW